jgi:hypothetical protein
LLGAGWQEIRGEPVPPNQTKEIWVTLRIIQAATINELVEATGWNRHVVELTMDLLIERGMVRCLNTDADEPRYEVIQR